MAQKPSAKRGIPDRDRRALERLWRDAYTLKLSGLSTETVAERLNMTVARARRCIRLGRRKAGDG